MPRYANVKLRKIETNCIKHDTLYEKYKPQKCQTPDFTGKRKRVFGNKAVIGETAAQPQNGPAATDSFYLGSTVPQSLCHRRLVTSNYPIMSIKSDCDDAERLHCAVHRRETHQIGRPILRR